MVTAAKVGRYEILGELGRGGMGVVYAATQHSLNRRVALKVLSPALVGDPEFLERFRNEAAVAASLMDAHILPVFDVLEARGVPVLVMPLVEGTDLGRIVRARHAVRQGQPPPQPHPWAALDDRAYLDRVLPLLDQIVAAVTAMHEAHVLHRDIKPGNVLVCERGGRQDVAKLLDFGLVRADGAHPDGRQLTQDGAIAGTPAYMSPEQAAGGDDLGARSDLYSLGAVAYFLLTGRPPFVRDGAVQTLAAHLGEPVVAPDRHEPGVPADLQAVVLRCLEKEPARRFVGADELAQALARCACAGRWTRERAAAWWRDHAAGSPQAAGAGVGR
jgi:eukaryotic-like serine/threonine-protein kinase